MDVGNVESNMRLFGILVMDQLLPDPRIVQESEFIFPDGGALCHTRFVVQLIVSTEAILL